LKGTPFLYNGEEIGMTDLELTGLSQIRDTAAINYYRLLTEKFGTPPEDALRQAIAMTRDRCRSPFQWSSAPNAGFSPPSSETWLPVNPNSASGVNVAEQEDDPSALLNFYRRMLSLRKSTPALIAGDYHALHQHSEDYFAFLRHDASTGQTCLVVLNFSPEEQTVIFDLSSTQARLLFSSQERDDRSLSLDWLTLAPFEIVVAGLV
jgi:alpha-glucosidase